MSRVRIAIIGSGPAGLSAAARAAKLGLSHIVLEKTDHLNDTIYRFQRQKHVMATPDRLPLRSDITFGPASRETVLEGWSKTINTLGVKVRLNADVKSIAGTRGDFTLTLADGATVLAETVVLCIGTAGNPNPLPCPGNDAPIVQYQLDDPKDHLDEDVVIVGGGDAGIENALGLADPDLGNKVTLVHRGADFARAKDANVQLLNAARQEGRLDVLTETTPKRVEQDEASGGWYLLLDTPDGRSRLKVSRIIARLGGAAPRKFVESCGVTFTGPDRDALPALSTDYESSVPGLYIIGALAGYPLIKHCLNQGHDVVERINGNAGLKPADEPLLEDKFKVLPGRQSVDRWLETIARSVEIFRELPLQQLRDVMMEATCHFYRKGDLVIERDAFGNSMFTIVDGTLAVEIDPKNPKTTMPIPTGTIVGEVGLISGRRRSATVRAGTDAIVLELSRTSVLKLMLVAPDVRRAIGRITTERQIRTLFGQDLAAQDIADIVAAAEAKSVNRGDVLIAEGDMGKDVYIVRFGSMSVSRKISGKDVFISYVPAGAYVGEMALLKGTPRTATVTAAIKSEVIRLPGDVLARIVESRPALRQRLEAAMTNRLLVDGYIEAQQAGFSSVVDYYTSIANFVIQQGLGEATDALLIDETLCIGCDNCERACADSHEGISRLDREAGPTYANIHVPTSCRHCEHPHCMEDCPPDAIHRATDGEVFITDACIGCGNCQRNCPYGVIQMAAEPPKKPGLLNWMLFGSGPGPGQADIKWAKKKWAKAKEEPRKKAVKCDMCKDSAAGPACVNACPTGAAIRVSPEAFLNVTRSSKQRA